MTNKNGEYVKQHYLPGCYLGRFASSSAYNSQTVELRKKQLYLIRDNTNIPVTAESQGSKDYHYSLDDRETKENQIGIIEKDYMSIVSKLIETGDPNILDDTEKMRLFSFMTMVHFGNPNYRIPEGEERFMIWQRTSADHMKRMVNLQGKAFPNEKTEIRAILNSLDEQFDFVVYKKKSSADHLITSIDPAVFVTNDAGLLYFGVLPLTPNYVLILGKKSEMTLLRKNLTQADVMYLNTLQAHVSNNQLYSPSEVSASDMANIQKISERIPDLPALSQSHTGYSVNFPKASVGHFSFVSIE